MSVWDEVWHWAVYPLGWSTGSCATCGQVLLEGHRLCGACVQILNSEMGAPIRWAHPLKPEVQCRCLFDWVPGESDFLSQALVSLKGRGAQKTWLHFAEIFLRHHAADLSHSFAGDIHLLAIPSHDPNRRHAQDWAQALASLLGCEWSTPEPGVVAHKVEPTPQKRLRRSARLKRLQITGDAPTTDSLSAILPNPAKRIVWVDDVITTGATSLFWMHSVRTGGQPEVWSLARRSRLAP